MPLIRFDAFAYASKAPGTSCFFVEPQIWEVQDTGMKPLREAGTQMLPEIHENYRGEIRVGKDRGDGTLTVRGVNGGCAATLYGDFKTLSFQITEENAETGEICLRFSQ